MSDAYERLRDRSRWFRRLATLVLCALVAALLIETAMAVTANNRAGAVTYLLAYRMPVLFYIAGVWTIRRAFARLAEGEIFTDLLPALLRRLGFALAGGGLASVFLTQWLRRAFLGPANGSWASFDPPAITIGLAGLLLIVLGDLMRRAAAMKHELDGFF